ncbi:MAG: hypothetical protein IPI67_39715 [Myxococcales bacterium]|nr:hypothetical protein [Myxococcales bacterium]
MKSGKSGQVPRSVWVSSGSRPAWSGPSAARAAALALGFACLACVAATDGDVAPEPGVSNPTTDNLKGCYGKTSSTIPASGVYVLTTFGGPSEPQPLACGGHSKSGSWYYAASRQRYGCGTRVRIKANGKCVVAQTDDAGPDVCVEKAVGLPVMDASPLVGKALFGTAGLGWSDKKKVTVEVAPNGTPLGPCMEKGDSPGGGGSGGGSAGSGGSSAGGANAGGANAGGSSAGGAGGAGGANAGGSSAGGTSGSGVGCTPSLCGSAIATSDSFGECHCDSACTGYADCCSNYSSVCKGSGSGGSGSGGSAGSGGSSSGGSGGSAGGGQACSNDGACNPGNDGSGLICVGGKCVPGCKSNAQCPGIKTCKSGQCS